MGFWPKEAVEVELLKYMQQFRATRICPPGDASKFRGIAVFASTAQFGQLGRAPTRPFKQRQYTDRPLWGTSLTMERNVDFIEVLLDLKLERRVRVEPDSRLALVVASEARVEPNEPPDGGVMICDPESGSRTGGFLEFEEVALGLWGLTFQEIQDGRQPMALCEAAMVPLTCLQWSEWFRGRRAVRYVDNAAAMATFVKGASAIEYLEKIVGLFWMLACHLGVNVWFACVDSDSNWSDGFSREFEADELTRELGFELSPTAQPQCAWAKSWMDLWLYAQGACEERALV